MQFGRDNGWMHQKKTLINFVFFSLRKKTQCLTWENHRSGFSMLCVGIINLSSLSLSVYLLCIYTASERTNGPNQIYGVCVCKSSNVPNGLLIALFSLTHYIDKIDDY